MNDKEINRLIVEAIEKLVQREILLCKKQKKFIRSKLCLE